MKRNSEANSPEIVAAADSVAEAAASPTTDSTPPATRDTTTPAAATTRPAPLATLDIEEVVVEPKAGYFVTKKAALLTGGVVVVVLVAVILITYFAKAAPECDNCQNFICRNRTQTQLLLQQCANPVTTRPPTGGPTRTQNPTTSAGRTTTTPAPPKINYRLPTNLAPTLYELTIRPFFKPETVPEKFTGSLILHFDCKAQTNRLVLNMRFIEINNASMVLTSPSDAQYGELKGFRYTYDPVTHFMSAELSKPFRAGQKYILKLDYNGLSQFDETGFYRAYYTDANGNRRWLITSQMQYIEARKAFPCFDEPAFKAIFRLTIIHDKSLTARSNNEIISSVPNGQSDGYDWQMTKFEDTPVMSSYLIAILISDFDCMRGYALPSANRNITIDVCARPTGKNDLGLALESAIKTSEFFERYYGIEYPLTKLDHVGVPQFKYGAMENWGLAVYFENNFLYNEMTSSQTTEMNVVRVIAHEVSHMWFGNWVTPKWWNDLWLNEGFARYMEHAGADYVRPAWRMFDRLFNLLTDVIQQDSTDETREVSADVETPDEINDNINPTITYGKGGAMVKMITYILSGTTFQKGLTKYFGKFGYQNVDQFDLWKTLEEQAKLEGKLSGVNLSETMRTWTYQKGHPVLHVRLVGNNRVELEQSRFLLDSTYPVSQLKNMKWHIPFSYSIESNTAGAKTPVSSLTVTDANLFDKITWLRGDKQTVTLSASLADGDYLLANLDMAGFYRVNYDEKNWNALINQLNTDHLKLSARARTQLISDSFSLSQAGYLDAQLPLNLINFMSKEFDYLPWNTFVNNRISFYNNMLQSSEFFGKYKEYIRGLITPYYTKLGWIEDKVNDLWVDRSVRNAIVDMTCRMDQSECVNTARSYFKQWMSNSNSNNIPAGPRPTAYCTAIRFGTETEFNFLYEQLNAADKSGASRADILLGLACSKDEWALDKLLNERLRLNKDVIITIRNVINRSSFTVAWNFIKANWDHLYSNSTTTDLRNVLNDLSNKLNTQTQHDDLVSFFSGKTVDAKLKKELDIIVKKVKANVNWFNKNRNSLSEWFESNNNGGGLINYRLPSTLIPSAYHLTIKAYVGTNDTYGDKAFTYEGYMKMTFKCAEATDRVIFHSVGHNINPANLSISSTSDNTGLTVVKSVEYDLLREFAIVRLSKQCRVNSVYVLGVSYTANLNDNLYGFYKSSYVNAQGKRVYLATTDFQPSKARYAFPCFDEPALKATFKLTAKRDLRFFTGNALFNRGLEENHSETDENGVVWMVDTFRETVPLSTYLVCFVISDFTRVQQKSGKGIDIQVYARPQAIQAGDGDFGLSEAVAVIDFFADYFNIPYPLEKSTQIAIPDFNPGAMENWGLITYRESSLLYNPNRDTILEKRRVAVVVSHELAHQWFGNLVTPKWWNDLWLNEGFASFVEYLGLNHTQPDWRDLDFFFVQKLSTMFKDSLESSHAISVEVNEPGETSSLFDKISYDKGSSIIRMMNAFLTEQTFKKGVTNYLKRYEYGSAEQDNLWEELTKQAHADSIIDKSITVKQIMDTWTLRKGYPVVHIERDYAQNEMSLKQSWFLVNPLNKVSPAEFNQYRWWVPLTLTNQKELNFNIESPVTWLRPEQNDQIVKLASNVDSNTWVVANLQHSGFFRVNYDEANWNLLIRQLTTNYAPIHPINRATLIDDSFNLGRAELIDQLKFFELVKYAKSENDSLPFTPVIYAFNSLTPLVATDYDTYTLMQNFVKSILGNTYDRLGWKTDLTDPNDVNLQISANQLMCKFGKQECIDSAKKIYKDWFESDIPINPNFKSNVFSTAMRYGTEAEWHALYDKAIQSADYSERLRMLRGLAATQNYELLKYLTSKTSDPDVVKGQDEVSLLQTIASNNIGGKLVYDYLEEEWDYFFGKYGGVSFTLPNLVEAATSSLSARSDLKRVENFVLDHPDLGVAEAAFQNAIETININIRWLDKNLASVNTWLQNNQ